MRFEFNISSGNTNRLYESPEVFACCDTSPYTHYKLCQGCGSYGLNSNSDNTTKPPCIIAVDVNGDKKPNPENVNCKDSNCAKAYKYSDATGTKLTDLFSIMITDKSAIPYGIAAQKAMYNSRK